MMDLPAVIAANRSGKAVGLPSYCTAHRETLAAILMANRDGDGPVLIEATCNQVNQHGGYTGMTPRDFRRFVEALAEQSGVEARRLILGGDHLGPNPWKNRGAAEAMDRARALVADYVRAGFTKIHLDASMACADDGDLSEAVMAERAAELCRVAEAQDEGARLHYVIGTEVPVPGGETEALSALAVTSPAAVRHTVELHRAAFAKLGLAAAFERVIGVVVQPGVDFGNDQVIQFDPAAAAALSGAVAAMPGLVFEAHSTDYQSAGALAGLVAGHFAILKVGPELTFAYRQAISALAQIEAALDLPAPSCIVETILGEMHGDPGHWRPYVARDARESRMMLYGLSDRVRYYWPRPAIQAALRRLEANLASAAPESGLVAQFSGALVDPALRPHLPARLVQANVGQVVAKYRQACGN